MPYPDPVYDRDLGCFVGEESRYFGEYYALRAVKITSARKVPSADELDIALRMARLTFVCAGGLTYLFMLAVDRRKELAADRVRRAMRALRNLEWVPARDAVSLMVRDRNALGLKPTSLLRSLALDERKAHVLNLRRVFNYTYTDVEKEFTEKARRLHELKAVSRALERKFRSRVEGKVFVRATLTVAMEARKKERLASTEGWAYAWDPPYDVKAAMVCVTEEASQFINALFRLAKPGPWPAPVRRLARKHGVSADKLGRLIELNPRPRTLLKLVRAGEDEWRGFRLVRGGKPTRLFKAFLEYKGCSLTLAYDALSRRG